MQYADVIIDIVNTALDRTFEYRVPEALEGKVNPGDCVKVPFGKGSALREGYVVSLSDIPEIEPDKIKDITSVNTENVAIESQLIRLAAWMKDRYGCTMIQALKTVLPVKKKIRPAEKKYIVRTVSADECAKLLEVYRKKNQKARARFLEALAEDEVLPYEMVIRKLRVTAQSFDIFIGQGICRLEKDIKYRNPVSGIEKDAAAVQLNVGQQAALTGLIDVYNGDRRPSLIYGITGSGKTEVYMEFISYVMERGQQAIVLIPEIALTWQTVMRFYRRFGDKVSIIHSKLSAGEKYDQLEAARRGDISIMIGPRSALFTPFPNLGVIIIDEEHESAYKSETAPRYSAVETAEERCRLSGAMTVLGSATPSAGSYYRAQSGEYHFFKLNERAREESSLPSVEIVDLKKELKDGNRSIFSRRLTELMSETLARGEQILLFLNRRGYAGFLSCRLCGAVIKCPHCDVSLKTHRDGKLHCHYCGYEEPIPKVCPSCGSKYIAAFGTGTQKVETLVKEMFPKASVLRMDADTTSKKGSHDAILSAFADGKADILIGTQMIVKGHDFPRVTLVGILAADLSLYSGGYEAAERTFDLITQAAGRAGRDRYPGNVVIQTYNPENYSVTAAASQDYEGFYWQEMLYRELLHYPPAYKMMSLLVTSPDEEAAKAAAEMIRRAADDDGISGLEIIGPAPAPISRIEDIYRYVLYVKCEREEPLRALKERIETVDLGGNVMYQFDIEG